VALQFSTAARNAALDARVAAAGNSQVIKVWSGSVPANCAAADTGTKLVEFDLPLSSWNAASGGQKTLVGLPITVAASGTGTAGNFRLYNSAATTCHMQGTVTAIGGGGDMTIDNLALAAGQSVVIFTFSLTEPGA
jgi:hypothetical protein